MTWPVVLLGPTGAGKSAVAMAAAAAVAGTEIVAVDAMQVYRGMDIGTAKPTMAERSSIRHHCLDLVEPSDPFSVTDYRAAYDSAAATIDGRPLLVAGTGLYLTVVIDRLEIPGEFPEARAALAERTLDELWTMLGELDPVAATRIEPGNRRRIERALEVAVGSGRPFSSYGPGVTAFPSTDAVLIGMRWPRAVSAERIAARVEAMLAAGLVDEVATVAAAGMSPTAAQALGYKEIAEHLAGHVSLDEAVATTVSRTKRYAARQERWYRRDPRVRWIDIDRDPVSEVTPVVIDALRGMTTPTAALTLTKHHGLGNDFLVVFHPGVADLPALARHVCDRRRGIGADGLLIGESHPELAAEMALFNADGSRAEMSGNGVRCFAQALAARRGSGLEVLRVMTDAGVRTVQLTATEDPATIVAAVDMGPVEVIAAPEGWAAISTNPDRPVLHLSLGNPHTVVGVDDVGTVDLPTLGRQVPGVNLEIIHPGPEPNAVTMRVHERGVGITEACGTGACAAAWAAAQWGLVDPDQQELVVHMDGGSVRIALHHPEPGRVTLTGPATYVGTIEVPCP